jgi:hypothetical protein
MSIVFDCGLHALLYHYFSAFVRIRWDEYVVLTVLLDKLL